MKSSVSLICLSLAAIVAAQFSGWQEGQVNSTICTWTEFRAALIRDTVYLDGGTLWWMPGLEDGSFGTVVNDGNVQGKVLTYNLSEPFDKDINKTGILVKSPHSKARGGSGNANTPNFIDGGMLANDAQFFMYGGAVQQNVEKFSNPGKDYVMGYQAYEYGSEKNLWDPSFVESALGDKVNRYIASGGAVSAPSENKAWYFSGLTSSTRGEIVSPVGIPRTTAKNVSNTLIQVDMEDQTRAEWTNTTLPGTVKGRAGSEVVWVPVGEQGILVVLGGVIYPDWATVDRKSENTEESEKQSPKFIQEIDIYDVAGKKWYKQTTEDGPKTRARGCAVVAPSSDYTSFNIYYYGGYDGIHPKNAYYDDVWVLSLPSFTWTQLNKGNNLHGRAGHRCFSPYSDQMMIFGGETALAGDVISCLDDGPVVLFNLTSGDWLESYDPTKHSDYGVPDAVLEKIGGDATGGATATAPSPSGWEDDALGDIFGSSYDKSKIKTWGPFDPVPNETERPELPNDGDDGKKKGSGLPSWVAPVLGVVLGLVVLSAALVIFCLWRKRKFLKNGGSENGTEDAGKRILSWMKGQPSQPPTEKTPTVTTSDDLRSRTAPLSPEMGELRNIGAAAPAPPSVSPPTQSPDPEQHEMGGTPIAELGDTSPPAELSGTAMSAAQAAVMRSRSPSDPSELSNTSPRSSVTGYNSRPDSPELPVSPEPYGDGHMRSLSETLAGFTVAQPHNERRDSDDPGDLSPISPPTAVDPPASDYVSARAVATNSPRPSAFREHEEDLEDKK